MTHRLHACSFAALLGLALPTSLAAQSPVRLSGAVRTQEGAPVRGANVFVLETLDGTLTDSTGRFAFTVSASRPLTLLVKRLGFHEVRRELAASDTGEIVISLMRAPTPLAPITVQAGAYTAGEERGATLTPLEVVTTPGTSADVHRAIQLLPGVQAVDDGTALFVRGGDYTETRVFMNEAPLLNPAQLLTPTGTFVGTVDPFQLDGIFFSSGGFGARYGNALSGVVGLRTRGASTSNAATVGAGLAAYSADVALRPSPAMTVRGAVNRLDLDPFFRVNGNPRSFSPSPTGHDLSASATFTYGVAGELKAYLLDQTNLVGVPVDDPSFTGTFNSDVASGLMVLTWKDVVGPASLTASASSGRLDRREDFGAFRFTGDQQQRQLFAQATWEVRPGAIVRFGGEVERVRSAIEGSLPESPADRRPGGRTTLFALDAPGARSGAFSEIELQPSGMLKVVPGLRVDRSTLTSRTTLDPRLALSWRLVSAVTATAAWGVYHQIPDPLYFDNDVGRQGLPPMRAMQWVAGLQTGEGGSAMARIEVYRKRYDALALQNRGYHVTEGGTGTSRGADFFLKGSLPGGVTTRSIVNYLVARRTDPDVGIQSRAPFDVTWSGSFIAERAFTSGLRAGFTYRASTGRPYTPVIGADFDPSRDTYVPRYGAPMSERFPGVRRLDISISRYRPITPTLQSVVYLSLSNVLDRDNVQSWRYARDYSSKSPLPSIFNRSIYFGASLLWQQENR